PRRSASSPSREPPPASRRSPSISCRRSWQEADPDPAQISAIPRGSASPRAWDRYRRRSRHAPYRRGRRPSPIPHIQFRRSTVSSGVRGFTIDGVPKQRATQALVQGHLRIITKLAARLGNDRAATIRIVDEVVAVFAWPVNDLALVAE